MPYKKRKLLKIVISLVLTAICVISACIGALSINGKLNITYAEGKSGKKIEGPQASNVIQKKTVKCLDWDTRTYQIDLYCAHNYSELKSCNIAISLDLSGSMPWIVEEPEETVKLSNLDDNYKEKTVEMFTDIAGISAWDYDYYVKDSDDVSCDYIPITWDKKAKKWKRVVSSENGEKEFSDEIKSNEIIYKRDNERTKLEALKDGIKLFINKVNSSTSNSYLSLTPFAGNLENPLQQFDSDELKEYKSFFNTMKKSTDYTDEIIDIIFDNVILCGRTRQDLAFEKNEDLLDDIQGENDNDNYVVMFSDGEPSGVETDVVDEIADNLRDKYTIMTAGIFANGESTAATNLVGWASAKKNSSGKYAYIATTANGLEQAFKEIFQEITITVNMDVIDYIDSRFTVVNAVDENGNNSGEIVTDDNGVQSVKWDNTEIVYSSDSTAYDNWQWHKTIIVKAKDSFIGGNNITTNIGNSGIEYQDTLIKFDQPHVNVKCIASVPNKSEVIFYGETLEENSVSLDVINDISEIQDLVDKDGNKVSSSDFVATWYNSNTIEDEINISSEIAKLDNNKDFYFTIKYNNCGDSTEESYKNSGNMKADGNLQYESGNNYGVYTIKVVKGQLNIINAIDKRYSDINVIKSNQGFIFKIERKNSADGEIKETFYETLTYDANNNILEGDSVIKGLRRGFYTVTLEDLWSDAYNLETIEDNYENNTEEGFDIFIGERKGTIDGKTIFFGLEDNENYKKIASGSPAEVNFSNKKNTSGWLSDVAAGAVFESIIRFTFK